LAVPLFLRGVDSHGDSFMDFTVALNISAGGALVATRRAIPPSSRLSLEIPSAPVPRLVVPPGSVRSLRGKIVRTITSEQFRFYAVQFNRPLI
jgi:hypothetical protein